MERWVGFVTYTITHWKLFIASDCKKIAFSVFAVLMEAISVRHSFAKYDYLNLFEIASMMRHI
jgi:hypothetical protein